MITHTQMRCLKAIRRLGAGGVCPSFDEMSAALGTTKTGVSRAVTRLCERGFLVRLPYRRRALEITAKGHAILPAAEILRYDPEAETFRPFEVM